MGTDRAPALHELPIGVGRSLDQFPMGTAPKGAKCKEETKEAPHRRWHLGAQGRNHDLGRLFFSPYTSTHCLKRSSGSFFLVCRLFL